RRLWRLDREEPLRPQIHGHRPQHLLDRRQGRRAADLAQGEGAGACRPGARSAEGPEVAVVADLAARAVAILASADPAAKVALTRVLVKDWRNGRVDPPEIASPPDRPARPAHPVLVHPRAVPKRKIGAGVAGRIALLHALAHIELNAIDL